MMILYTAVFPFGLAITELNDEKSASQTAAVKGNELIQ